MAVRKRQQRRGSSRAAAAERQSCQQHLARTGYQLDNNGNGSLDFRRIYPEMYSMTEDHVLTEC